MDELQRQLTAFSKRYGAKGQQIRARIEFLMVQGIKPEEAVRQAFKEYGMEEWLQANIADAVVAVAEVTLGEDIAQNLSSSALLEALSNPWDGSGMKLSEKIHGTSKAMRDSIVSTVKQQVRLNKTVKDTARSLYDGYNAGRIVQKQDLPQYMDGLVQWTRRSRDNLTEAEAKDLQRAIRKVRAQAEDLVDDRSTYNHYRTSLNALLNKIDQGSEQAVQNAVRSAIEEKGRYIAERIARTEAARARYDAFVARYGDDDSVVAYRWKLGSRHPAEDICDMYAHADLYGLGRGVFPKDGAPVNPAHPHCLCHYAPVYASELKGKKQPGNVEDRGNAWLKQQPLHIRQAILGVKGEQEWKAGRAGWMEKARNFGLLERKQSRLLQGGALNGALNNKNDPNGQRRDSHAKLYYREIINNGKELFAAKISRNTGFSYKFIESVFEHVFINKHFLYDGYRKFDSSYDMAVSFQRLLTNQFTKADIVLLRHEHLEKAIEKRYNVEYKVAHILAEKKYNYSLALKREKEKRK